MTSENTSDNTQAKALNKTDVSGSGIDWKCFFSGGNAVNYECFYKAEINGKRVEKHTFRGGVNFSIGNIDLAKQKFKTEEELLKAIENEN